MADLEELDAGIVSNVPLVHGAEVPGEPLVAAHKEKNRRDPARSDRGGRGLATEPRG